MLALACASAGVALAGGIIAARADPPVSAAGQLGLVGDSASSDLPAAVVAAEGAMPDPDSMGGAVEAKARLVRPDLPGSHGRIYAFPTTKGDVCFVVTEGTDPGACVDRFSRSSSGSPVGVVVYWTRGMPLTVAGIAPPGVVGVDAVIDGQTYQASLVKSGFYVRSPDLTGTAKVTAVIVHYRDGTTLTRPVD